MHDALWRCSDCSLLRGAYCTRLRWPRLILVRHRASLCARFLMLFKLQSEHLFFRHPCSESLVVCSAKQVQTGKFVGMPLRPAMDALEFISMTGFSADAAAEGTPLRSVGGRHLHDLSAEKSGLEEQSLPNESSHPSREQPVHSLRETV